jgi:hypothetical protein
VEYLVNYFRGAAVSFISVVIGLFIIEKFDQSGISILFGIMPLIFSSVYLVCLVTELIINWAEFKFYQKPVELPISLCIGLIIFITAIFLLPIVSFLAVIGAIFFYLGRKLRTGPIVNSLIIFCPLLLLIGFVYPL